MLSQPQPEAEAQLPEDQPLGEVHCTFRAHCTLRRPGRVTATVTVTRGPVWEGLACEGRAPTLRLLRSRGLVWSRGLIWSRGLVWEGAASELTLGPAHVLGPAPAVVQPWLGSVVRVRVWVRVSGQGQ